METIKILIADDYEIIRYGISTYLSSADDVEVVGEASRGEECIDLFREKRPDVCLLDITMPGINGLETARKLKELDGGCKIVILSMYLDRELLAEAMQCGISGYLLKTTDKKHLLHCIRVIHNGQHVYSKSIANFMAKGYSPEKMRFRRLKNKITEREQEVLSLLVKGRTSMEIAEELYISPRTVETHRSNLLKKLDMKNTAELVRYALESKI